MRNWVSNAGAILHELGEPKSTSQSLEVGTSNETERVLGVLWDPEEDDFIFSTEIRQDLTSALLPRK